MTSALLAEFPLYASTKSVPVSVWGQEVDALLVHGIVIYSPAPWLLAKIREGYAPSMMGYSVRDGEVTQAMSFEKAAGYGCSASPAEFLCWEHRQGATFYTTIDAKKKYVVDRNRSGLYA